MPPPADVLRARLYELAGASLRSACGCCASSAVWPVDAIGSAYGSGLEVREVLRRLRCSVCGTRPPASVELVEWMDAGDDKTDVGWSVELVPALWPEPAEAGADG